MSGDLWPDAKVKVGTYIIFFGTAAEVLRVRDSGSFRAHELTLRTFDGAETNTLVPVDFEPVVIDWAVTSSNAGPAPRRPNGSRIG